MTMRLSPADQQTIDEVARRHGFSSAAVSNMLEAVLAGHGRMAQFNHPEFGGAGQWMRGGMTMVGDMFNAALKARVERLCDELSGIVAELPAADSRLLERASFTFRDIESGNWWPPDLGRPDSAGAQNAIRYAYFAAPRRLAIDAGGRVTVYDTLDHRIGGVSQQQSAHASLTFSSQHGAVDVATLPLVSGEREPQRAPDLVATIEQLAQLRSKGILTEAEFAAKKAELLSRL
jgi:hypothetical protein